MPKPTGLTYWEFTYSPGWGTFRMILKVWPTEEPIRSIARLAICREFGYPEHRAAQIDCKLKQQLNKLPHDIENTTFWNPHKCNQIRQNEYHAWSMRVS